MIHKRSFKRYMLFFALLMSVFLTAGTNVWAAENDAEVNSNSEGISYHATCDKAGNISFAFDGDTVLTEGDVFYVDLPFGVTLCREIDIIVCDGIAGGAADAPVHFDDNGTHSVLLQQGVTPTADAPFYYTGGTVPTSFGGGIYFQIRGANGAQRTTVTVMSDDNAATGSLTIGSSTEEDTMVLVLFDQRINATLGGNFTGDYMFIDDSDPADGVYETDATVADNTMCIDVENYDIITIDVSLDSAGDKFNFDPTNPEIAHVLSAVTYTLKNCKGTETCGNVPIESEQDSICSFDFEAATNYCDDFDGGRIVIETSALNLDDTDYNLSLTISGAGVYFGGNTVSVQGYDYTEDPCVAGGVAINPAFGAYLADGSTSVSSFDSGTCDVDDDDKAVILRSANFNPKDYKYLYINLPAFVYSQADVTNNETVSVTVVLTKEPCSISFNETICVATMVDNCGTALTTTTLVYPYFPEMASPTWTDGFVIINQSSSDGEAVITFNEIDPSDGSLKETGTLTVTVPANGMYVKTLASIIGDISSGGTMGGDKLWIRVVCEFNADGFGIMYTSTLAQGYLPRVH